MFCRTIDRSANPKLPTHTHTYATASKHLCERELIARGTTLSHISIASAYRVYTHSPRDRDVTFSDHQSAVAIRSARDISDLCVQMTKWAARWWCSSATHEYRITNHSYLNKNRVCNTHSQLPYVMYVRVHKRVLTDTEMNNQYMVHNFPVRLGK